MLSTHSFIFYILFKDLWITTSKAFKNMNKMYIKILFCFRFHKTNLYLQSSKKWFSFRAENNFNSFKSIKNINPCLNSQFFRSMVFIPLRIWWSFTQFNISENKDLSFVFVGNYLEIALRVSSQLLVYSSLLFIATYFFSF